MSKITLFLLLIGVFGQEEIYQMLILHGDSAVLLMDNLLNNPCVIGNHSNTLASKHGEVLVMLASACSDIFVFLI